MPKPQERYAINPSFVWITARDGSVHATRPPLIANGQTMLCGHSYDRRDLRVRVPSAAAPIAAGLCAICVDHVTTARGEGAAADRERKPPLWP